MPLDTPCAITYIRQVDGTYVAISSTLGMLLDVDTKTTPAVPGQGLGLDTDNLWKPMNFGNGGGSGAMLEGTWTWVDWTGTAIEYQGDGKAWNYNDDYFHLGLSFKDANGIDHAPSLKSLWAGDSLFVLPQGYGQGFTLLVRDWQYIKNASNQNVGLNLMFWDQIVTGADQGTYQLAWGYCSRMPYGTYDYEGNKTSTALVSPPTAGLWGSVGGNPTSSPGTCTHLYFSYYDLSGSYSSYLAAHLRVGDLLRMTYNSNPTPVRNCLAKVTGSAFMGSGLNSVIVPVSIVSSIGAIQYGPWQLTTHPHSEPPVLVLGPSTPVPAGTPAGTVILRTVT